jgi:hypothetical protein
MSRRVDFLVLGAQKCATSWLHYCLSDHPGLYLPAKKREEVEYLGGEMYEAHGADWYFSLFAEAQESQKTGAVSVQYLFDARAPVAVHQYIPNVKLIVSLRDPIDRAISAYFWYLRKGEISTLDIEDWLGMAVRDYNACQELQTEKYYKDIITRGFYDVQLERYLKYFKAEQMLVLLYDEIQACPGEVLKKIYDFIGVDIHFQPASFNKKPKVNTYLSPFVYLERLAPKSRFMGKFVDLSNRFLHRIGIEKEKPAISQELYRKLQDTYAVPMEKTKNIVRSMPPAQQPFSIEILDTWLHNRRITPDLFEA